MLVQHNLSVVTTRRYVSAVLAVIVCLSVCPFVILSVMCWYCVKVAKCRIKQTTPHNAKDFD